MKTKFLFFVVISTLFFSCDSGPTACECLDIYEYKGVNVSTFSEDIKGKDPRPCIEKFGKGITPGPTFPDKIKEVLRKECNK